MASDRRGVAVAAVTRDMLGFVWLACAVALFSTIEVVAKAISPVRPPLQLAFWRFLIGGLALLPAAGAMAGREARTLGGRDLVQWAGLGLIGVTLGIGLYHGAVARMPAHQAAILFSAHPVIVAVMAPAVLGERIRREQLLALGLALAGTACFLAGHGGLDRRAMGGVALMLASMTAFALYTLLSKKAMERRDPLWVAAGSFLMGAAGLLPVTWLLDGAPWRIATTRHWWAILYLALLATAAGYGAYFHGMRQLAASQAAMMFFLKPVLATLFSLVLLGERPTLWSLIGGALIVVAMAVVKPERRVAG
ncbi:MAG: DMT family transporter [Kiritimatiellae bacterium]|nr:DMT family transporter [Kiritimatiellia bacterium]